MAKLFAFTAGAGRRQFGSVMLSSPRTFDVLLSAPALARARLAQLRICSGRFR
jgi:hypothetical protein